LPKLLVTSNSLYDAVTEYSHIAECYGIHVGANAYSRLMQNSQRLGCYS